MPTPEEMAEVLGQPQGDWANAMEAVNAQAKSRRDAMASMLRNTVGVPGTVMQPIAPQTPGVWSDEDEARRLATEGFATDQTIRQGVNSLGTGAPMAERGAAGIFGGRLAKTADLDQARRAINNTIKGASPEEVWGTTGWFRGPDKKWRFEIPDAEARIKAMPNEERHLTMASILHHPELYEAYPNMKNIQMDWSGPTNEGAFLRPGQHPHETIQLSDGNLPDELEPIMLHEAQHAVQEREGFSPGNNPSSMNKYVTAALLEHGIMGRSPAGNLTYKRPVGDVTKLGKNLGFETYRRHAGEVEARNVAERYNLHRFQQEHPQYKEKGLIYDTPPWATQDVDPSKVIVRPPAPLIPVK